MTLSSTINISSDRVVQWMNVIRNTSGTTQYRLLENFWESQLRSKAWLINTLKTLNLTNEGDVYIFGGWYGVLGSLIKDNFIYDNVYSVDVDPICKEIGQHLDDRIKFITSDMTEVTFTEENKIGLIINTSTEHVTQEVYDQWYNSLPINTPVILQGNNFYSCEEHVRCTKNIKEFIKINKLVNILFTGELDCGVFTRFMTIGYKI